MSKWTWFVILSAVALWIGYDVFDFIKDPTGTTTISWQLYQASLKYPVIPFIAGAFCAHIWAGQHGE